MGHSDDVLKCKKNKEQPGPLFAANALAELINFFNKKEIQAVESRVIDVWERKETTCCPCQMCQVSLHGQAVLSAGTVQGQQAEMPFLGG